MFLYALLQQLHQASFQSCGQVSITLDSPKHSQETNFQVCIERIRAVSGTTNVGTAMGMTNVSRETASLSSPLRFPWPLMISQIQAATQLMGIVVSASSLLKKHNSTVHSTDLSLVFIGSTSLSNQIRTLLQSELLYKHWFAHGNGDHDLCYLVVSIKRGSKKGERAPVHGIFR